MTILVKVSGCLSQFIFIFVILNSLRAPRCLTVSFSANAPDIADKAVLFTITKTYDSRLLCQFFFDVVQQTVQHCRVALLKQSNALRQPVDHFHVIVDA